MTTVGAGRVTTAPDAARLSVSVLHTASSVAEALEGCAAAMVDLGEVARRFVADEAISSRGLNVWQQRGPTGEPAGFEARHQVEVVCGGLAQAGEVVTALATVVGDALELQGMDPFVRDPAPLLVVARESAFADARAKADHLAGLAGQQVVGAVSVSEGGAGGDVPVFARAAAKDFATTSFEPGSTAISATVSVVWESAPR